MPGASDCTYACAPSAGFRVRSEDLKQRAEVAQGGQRLRAFRVGLVPLEVNEEEILPAPAASWSGLDHCHVEAESTEGL